MICIWCDGALSGQQTKFCSQKCKNANTQRHRTRDHQKQYQATKEYRKRKATEYARLNPHVPRLTKAKRRAQKKSAGIFKVTQRDWLRICRRYDNRCAYCHEIKPLTMDHVIPLSRGGRHSIGNLIPACHNCNCSKHARFITEWRMSPGRG